MDVTLLKIENVEGHDVTFLKIKTEYNEWITAYVRFDSPIGRDECGYPTETYNENDVYGVDTAHLHNERMSIDEKIEDARRQILEIILIHDGKFQE